MQPHRALRVSAGDLPATTTTPVPPTTTTTTPRLPPQNVGTTGTEAAAPMGSGVLGWLNSHLSRGQEKVPPPLVLWGKKLTLEEQQILNRHWK